jgi:hypothetical protein
MVGADGDGRAGVAVAAMEGGEMTTKPNTTKAMPESGGKDADPIPPGKWRLEFEAAGVGAPLICRIKKILKIAGRKILKIAGRGYGLRCTSAVEINDGNTAENREGGR